MDKQHALLTYFGLLEDPRKDRHCTRHALMDIVMLCIIAVICGAESWVAVERFGKAKQE